MQYLTVFRFSKNVITQNEIARIFLAKNIFQLCSIALLKIEKTKMQHNRIVTFSTTTSNFGEEKNFEDLRKWIKMHKFEGGKVPRHIKHEDLKGLLEIYQVSLYKASQQLQYLFDLEHKKMVGKKKKELIKQLNYSYSKYKLVYDTNHIKYGLWDNSLFGKINKSDYVHYHNSKVITAMKFGQPIIYDCSFDDDMVGIELSAYVKHMVQSIAYNRYHDDPFNIYMCNQNLNSTLFKKMNRLMSTIRDSAGPNITSNNYLDIFPREKLIYLTQDASVEMTSYDHNAIYIVGGIVNLINRKQLSLAKSKRDGIKSMKLPLERYHKFIGRRVLGIHVMTSILLELKMSGNFNKAFDFIPSKLLVNHHQRSYRDSPWDEGSIKRKSYRAVKNKFSILEAEIGNNMEEVE